MGLVMDQLEAHIYHSDDEDHMMEAGIGVIVRVGVRLGEVVGCFAV